MLTVGKVITLGPLPEPANPEIGYVSFELFKIPGFQEMLLELFKFPVHLGSVSWNISCASPEDIPHVTVEYIPVEVKNYFTPIAQPSVKERKPADAPLHNDSE